MRNGEILGEYEQAIRELSDHIVTAQKPIRILDSLKWDPAIEEQFFRHKCKRLPSINRDFYLEKNPLSYSPEKKLEEFREIDRSIRRKLGQYSGVGSIMQRMCYEYCRVIEMLQARGTSHFTEISQELYGSSEDAFHIGAPTLKDMALLVTNTLANIKDQVKTKADEETYTSEEVVDILGKRLDTYFGEKDLIRVEISDGIIADAAAGADRIKIHKGLKFSLREIRTFEIHEGWVHLGTTLIGTFFCHAYGINTVSQTSYPAGVR